MGHGARRLQPDGDAWDYFPHEQARSRAYRWNEDGLAGICDRHQRICFALALWNGRDPILKERLFGLTGTEGNHGEDVKEYYFYLDSTPTHSYMKLSVQVSAGAFPVRAARRTKNSDAVAIKPEFELHRHRRVRRGPLLRRLRGVCEGRARKTSSIEITIANRGPEAATIHVLPTVWFRNTWSWAAETTPRPALAPPHPRRTARSSR